MKKLVFLSSAIASFLTPVYVSAIETEILINKKQGEGYATIGDFVGNLITISFSVAIVVALVMLIWGAFEWSGSGGDKEGVAKARGRIINALIGLAVLAIAFALATLGANVIGVEITNLKIPGPK